MAEWPKVTTWTSGGEAFEVRTELGNRSPEVACAEHDADVLEGKKRHPPN